MFYKENQGYSLAAFTCYLCITCLSFCLEQRFRSVLFSKKAQLFPSKQYFLYWVPVYYLSLHKLNWIGLFSQR